MTQTNKSSQYVPGRNLLGALAVVLLALAVRPSQAAPGDLAFTIEEPGVQES
jgi:hypothetical protein